MTFRRTLTVGILLALGLTACQGDSISLRELNAQAERLAAIEGQLSVLADDVRALRSEIAPQVETSAEDLEHAAGRTAQGV